MTELQPIEEFMTKLISILTAGVVFISQSALAEGDVAKGEKAFKKCKSCHMIADGDEVIMKGGKTGPNLFGIVGKQVASIEGYKYGKSIVALGETGLVWDEALLAEYLLNPTDFLKTKLDDAKAKSKMSLKLKKGGEDVAAYLSSVAE